MAQPLREPQRMVVVGGGAGGLELAIRLARATRPGGRARVTLIDRRASHIWKPRLHEIAAGLLAAGEEAAGYAAQASHHGFAFVLGEVTGLDLQARRLQVAATPYPADDRVARGRGDLLPARDIAFDLAVLAVGSTINDFGTPGVAAHAYTLDTASDAERLHTALLAQAARVKAGLQPRVRVVVVGAGTTGVELAAELRDAAGRLSQFRSLIAADQLEVTIVEMGARALPGSAAELSAYAARMLGEHGVAMRFGAKVTQVDAGRVRLADGEDLTADVVVWASGVKAERLAGALSGLQTGPGGRIRLDAQLRVLGAAGDPVPGLYGLGDCAAPAGEDGKPLPATAQVASQQAQLLARSLARQTRGRAALAFTFRNRGTIVSLGGGRAVGQIPGLTRSSGLRFAGEPARLAYAGLYRAHLVTLFGWPRTAALTLSAALRRSAQPAVKLDW